ncbi:hypothetical protein PIB30_083243 [Stylosanthes scabra]|uniref:Uncharacterized protein n=1 Tax=Stylosanthes scabra TaxID=79078 RepID=A0ABU6XSC7_9FABA|nr:hypothetical protein [Stylosanthes scabra]
MDIPEHGQLNNESSCISNVKQTAIELSSKDLHLNGSLSSTRVLRKTNLNPSDDTIQQLVRNSPALFKHSEQCIGELSNAVNHVQGSATSLDYDNFDGFSALDGFHDVAIDEEYILDPNEGLLSGAEINAQSMEEGLTF